MADLTTTQSIALLLSMIVYLWLAITIEDPTTGQTIVLLFLCELCLLAYICFMFDVARNRLFVTVESFQVYFIRGGQEFDARQAVRAAAHDHQVRKDGRRANKQKEKPTKGKMSVHIR